MPNKCEWTTEVVSDEFDQMRESSFSSQMFWVINVVEGNYELTGKFDNTGFSREGDQVGTFVFWEPALCLLSY